MLSLLMYARNFCGVDAVRVVLRLSYVDCVCKDGSYVY